jgi:ABC-type phosphate transport system substrate-binding protein
MRAPLAMIVIVALAGCADAVAESGGVRVIVNAKNPATTLSKQFVADAFLKKRTRWRGDDAIQPVDLGQKHSVRARFSRSILERDVAAVRRYWAQLVFSGRGVPPPEVADEDAVIAYVAKNAGAIGYVSASTTLTGVKAVPID